MVKREFTFPSADGKTAIHAVEWLPEGTPRAVLQIAHGVSEYVLRYEDFARHLTERGFAVVGNDHLGHGLSVASGAPRLYFGPKGSWNWVVEDMEQLRKLTHEKFPNLPYFLLGHSMGSFLTRTYLIRYPGTVDAAVIMGTGYMNAAATAASLAVINAECLRNGASKPSAVATQASFGIYNRRFAPNRTSMDWLSLNPDNVDAYLQDPLCRIIPGNAYRHPLCLQRGEHPQNEPPHPHSLHLRGYGHGGRLLQGRGAGGRRLPEGRDAGRDGEALSGAAPRGFERGLS